MKIYMTHSPNVVICRTEEEFLVRTIQLCLKVLQSDFARTLHYLHHVRGVLVVDVVDDFRFLHGRLVILSRDEKRVKIVES